MHSNEHEAAKSQGKYINTSDLITLSVACITMLITILAVIIQISECLRKREKAYENRTASSADRMNQEAPPAFDHRLSLCLREKLSMFVRDLPPTTLRGYPQGQLVTLIPGLPR
ncbi:hypothetical protein P167DRAFT_579438 [Morchella conica CCBAS932]|uniref:Uncharacterized protein n=1 Tax=Morchella conica CCBAS932 TaxID=1392247 RepID=A0A3N4K9W4_9PEZI|nr:hypothetical protein P167DRAFT_579438 [Morchella conica CCBAS932]